MKLLLTYVFLAIVPIALQTPCVAQIDIRPQPGGKRLLYVDGTDVRPEPGGIRLAVIDGTDLRRSPGGKILLNYRHPDICPTSSEKRIYYVDGPELTGP